MGFQLPDDCTPTTGPVTLWPGTVRRHFSFQGSNPMQRRETESADGCHLLARAIDGDRSAMGELLYRQSDELRAFISRRLPAVVQPTFEVDDVLQDTFALAFRGIRSFEGTEAGSFAAWLRTIADNRLRDLTRTELRQKRGGADCRALPAGTSDTIYSLYHELAGIEATPLRNASRDEAVRLMYVALADLPSDYRNAIRLRYLEGRPTEEVADLLGRTPDAIRGVIKRAKDRLREALGRASGYLSSR